MPATYHDQVLARLCPHRGIGLENTLAAIGSGIKASPYLVEFDVQRHKHDLYLGHPPEIRSSTLRQALELFKNTLVLPKIDIKLTYNTSNLALEELIDQLLKLGPLKVLINISGSLDADQYMQAEAKLITNTKKNVLLNIDLERYWGKSNSAIASHLSNLKRAPFNISPNLETNSLDAINFATQHNIHHIHYWAYYDKQYTTANLYERLNLGRMHDLQVYFDIKTQNISDL